MERIPTKATALPMRGVTARTLRAVSGCQIADVTDSVDYCGTTLLASTAAECDAYRRRFPAVMEISLRYLLPCAETATGEWLDAAAMLEKDGALYRHRLKQAAREATRQTRLYESSLRSLVTDRQKAGWLYEYMDEYGERVRKDVDILRYSIRAYILRRDTTRTDLYTRLYLAAHLCNVHRRLMTALCDTAARAGVPRISLVLEPRISLEPLRASVENVCLLADPEGKYFPYKDDNCLQAASIYEKHLVDYETMLSVERAADNAV